MHHGNRSFQEKGHIAHWGPVLQHVLRGSSWKRPRSFTWRFGVSAHIQSGAIPFSWSGVSVPQISMILESVLFPGTAQNASGFASSQYFLQRSLKPARTRIWWVFEFMGGCVELREPRWITLVFSQSCHVAPVQRSACQSCLQFCCTAQLLYIYKSKKDLQIDIFFSYTKAVLSTFVWWCDSNMWDLSKWYDIHQIQLHLRATLSSWDRLRWAICWEMQKSELCVSCVFISISISKWYIFIYKYIYIYIYICVCVCAF